MNLCQRHWDVLKAAIVQRGLSALISETGEQAASNIVSELQDGRSIDNYDPLMAAYWAIGSNGMTFISDGGGNPWMLMTEWPAEGDPNRPPFDRCTICYLNWMMDEHDRLCNEPLCQKPKGDAAHFDWMIERAADEQVEVWKGFSTQDNGARDE